MSDTNAELVFPEPDFKAAQDNANQLIQKSGHKIQHLIAQAMQLLEQPLLLDGTAPALYGIASNLSDLIVPFTPCGSGCSHCCNMAVTVNSYEAEVIRKATGQYMVEAGRSAVEFGATADQLHEKYRGVPCPFLKEGKCSIYSVRPIICRTHHSLMKTDQDCAIGITVEGASRQIAGLDLTAFFQVHMALFQKAGCTYADIREFFPPEG